MRGPGIPGPPTSPHSWPVARSRPPGSSGSLDCSPSPFAAPPRRHLDKALEWATAAGHDVAGQEFGDSAAVATVPMPYATYPKVLAKAQVAGTDLPRDNTILKSATGPQVHLLGTLSTGKAAAQAAHALWLWALPQLTDAPSALAAWALDGMPMSVSTARAEVLTDLAGHGPVVRDAGLTEVAPNTVTAVVSTM